MALVLFMSLYSQVKVNGTSSDTFHKALLTTAHSLVQIFDSALEWSGAQSYTRFN